MKTMLKKNPRQTSLLNRGRHPVLSETEVKEILASITEETDSAQGAHTDETLDELIYGKLEQFQRRKGLGAPPSKSSEVAQRRIKRVKEKLTESKHYSRRKGDKQSRARAVALDDLRNAVSLVAAVRAILEADEKPLSPTRMFNLDGFTFVLSSQGSHALPVYIDKRVDQEMKQRGLGIKAKGGAGKSTTVWERVKCLALTSAAGKLHKVILHARVLPQGEKEPKVIRLPRMFNAGESEAVLLLLPQTEDFNDKALFKKVFEEYVFPTMKKVKQREEQDDVDDADNNYSDRMLLTLDGEISQLQTLTEDDLRAYMSLHNIELLKFAASSSGFQQPNDLMKSHVISKSYSKKLGQFLKGYVASYKIPGADKLPKLLQTHVPTLAAGKRKLIVNLLLALPTILDDAFPAKNIKAGWGISGVHPFDAEVMLSQHKGYRAMQTNERAIIHQAIGKLVSHLTEHGYIEEAKYDELKVGQLTSRDYDLLPLWRQRAMWISHPLSRQFLWEAKKARQLREAATLAKKEERKKRKAAKKAQASGVMQNKRSRDDTAGMKSYSLCSFCFQPIASISGKWYQCAYQGCAATICPKCPQLLGFTDGNAWVGKHHEKVHAPKANSGYPRPRYKTSK